MEEKETSTAVGRPQRLSLVAAVAAKYDLEPQTFLAVVKKTVFPQDRECSNEQVAAFLAVCQQYELNPFTREIFAFPTKGGGIQPIVSVDGWVKLIVGHPQYDGMDIKMELDEKGKPLSCTCTIYRKDRANHVTPVTEYFDECYRDTEPWRKMPKRMLRHKAIKEAGRITMGFAGIQDEDEGLDAIRNITGESVEMERTTNAKTDELKKKIGAKKETKTEQLAEKLANPENAKAAVETAKTAEQPKVDNFPPPMPPAQQEETPPPPTEPEPPQVDPLEDNNKPDPEAQITPADRDGFLTLVTTRYPEYTTNQNVKAAVQKAVRQKLMEFGYAKTSEIRYKNFDALKKWAQEFKA